MDNDAAQFQLDIDSLLILQCPLSSITVEMLWIFYSRFCFDYLQSRESFALGLLSINRNFNLTRYLQAYSFQLLFLLKCLTADVSVEKQKYQVLRVSDSQVQIIRISLWSKFAQYEGFYIKCSLFSFSNQNQNV